MNKQKVFVGFFFFVLLPFHFDLPKVKAFVYTAHHGIDSGYNVFAMFTRKIYVCSIVCGVHVVVVAAFSFVALVILNIYCDA